jgi:photosystem II stability/assembly factor-like uncharacterized protein
MLHRGVFALVLACLLPLTARSAESAELAPLAAQALLLDVTNAGDRLVAVGDHGHILISRDSGKTWTQSPVPARAMLTGVSFPDAQHGWAVGHDGVILATTDGGETWQRQDDGKNLETVLLDVYFRDLRHGFAVGAYGKFYATTDGGKSWSAAKPAADEVHYNRITGDAGGYLYLAGESGTVLTSADDGKTWTHVEVPYDGSLFGVLPLDKNGIVTYGLRGHILRSDDHGRSWEPLHSEVKVLIMAGRRLANGTVVLGGQGGNFFISRDGGHHFTHWKPAGFGTGVAALAEAADGTLVTVGEAGAVRLTLP